MGSLMGWNTSGKRLVMEDKGMRQRDWCLCVCKCESGCVRVCVQSLPCVCCGEGG